MLPKFGGDYNAVKLLNSRINCTFARAAEINDVYPDKSEAVLKFLELLRDPDLPKVYSREFVENNKDIQVSSKNPAKRQTF